MITAKQSSESIFKYSEGVNVVPVIVLDDVAVATDLAKILVDAGMPILEVTLRTPNALKVIEAMAKVDGAILASGTVLDESHVNDSKSAGAKFLVSPGYTEALHEASSAADMPLLPGTATASEIMKLSEKGFSFLKFFPAGVNGGVPALKSFASPLPQVSFCPTGGVNEENMSEYLSVKNVECVGGSWLVTQADIADRNWSAIKARAEKVKAFSNS